MKLTTSFETHEKITTYEIDRTEFFKMLNIDADQIVNIVPDMDIIHMQVRKSLEKP